MTDDGAQEQAAGRYSFKYVEIPYEKAEAVEPEHRNKIVVGIMFMVKPGCTNLRDTESHVPIKRFSYSTICEDREYHLEQEKNLIYSHVPADIYDHSLSSYENMTKFNRVSHEERYRDWTKTVPLDQQILLKFEWDESVGCGHYIRGCQVRCETCKGYFPCRICHDEEVADHSFPRYDTAFVKCNYCHAEQPISQKCTACGVVFAAYYCKKCRLLCDMGAENKPNYHCNGCGCCMVGTEETLRHCYKCNMCWQAYTFDKHTCVQIDGNCVVCMQDLKHSTFGTLVMNCGHFIHLHCYQQLIDNNIFRCPVCKKFFPVQEDRKRILKWQSNNYNRYLIEPRFQFLFLMAKCNDCGEEFPQIYSPLRLYYCNKCHCYNCEQVNTDKGYEQLFSDYHTYYEQFGDEPVRQNIANKANVIRALLNLDEKYKSVGEVASYLEVDLENMDLQDIQRLASALNHFPNNMEALKKLLDRARSGALDGEEDEEGMEEEGR